MNFKTSQIFMQISTIIFVVFINYLFAQTKLKSIYETPVSSTDRPVIVLQGEKILFDNLKSNLLFEIRQKNNEVHFRINDSEVHRITFGENSKFYLITSPQKKYFTLIEFQFGGKSDLTKVNANTFDESFHPVDIFTFNYFYEEPIPTHKITDTGELILLHCDTGIIKKISRDGAIEKVLEKEIVENKERIGHLLLNKNKIIVGLSNLKNREESISKIFFLDEGLNILKSMEFNFSQLYSLHLLNNDNGLVSAYSTTKLEPNLFLFNEIESTFIGNFFVDNVITNEKVFIFDSYRVYNLVDSEVKELIRFEEGDEIVNVFYSENTFYIITKNPTGFTINVFTEDFNLKNKITLNSKNIDGWYFSKSRNKLFIFESTTN